MSNTSDTPFFSKSVRVGSVRWLLPSVIEGDTTVMRAYVMDCAWANTGTRWYSVLLVRTGDQYFVRCYQLGNDENVSLVQDSVRAFLLSVAPIIEVNITGGGTDSEILTKFERVVSNVMHGLLAPIKEVHAYWVRILDMPA